MDRRAPSDHPAPPLPLAGLVRPFQAFFHREASSGIVLLVCTIAAMVWANSRYGESYFDFWHTKFTIGSLTWSLAHWINDALMAVFFLVVGLEIKREVLGGELSSPKGAALPIAGALGGMVVPALIYAAITMTYGSAEARRGWAVPMATDIAFALGILALVGRRVPAGLRVFLAALAIADDLGAILVIAIFYTDHLSLGYLAAAGAYLVVLIIGNRMGVRRRLFYGLLGVALWIAVLQSGIHSTIAGVLLAMTIPADRRIDQGAFVARGRALFDQFAADVREPNDRELSHDQFDAVVGVERACEHVTRPLQRIQQTLHPWVAFGIMPLFALANAGVVVSAATARDAAGEPASIGAFVGLVVGKQVGVFAFAWLAVRTGLARLPAGATWPQLYGIACLCGIGFTMSLFIAGLAFSSPHILDHAKLAILAASTLSAVVGALLLATTGRAATARPASIP
jgi:NhaA family Na+:H+ antiporter